MPTHEPVNPYAAPLAGADQPGGRDEIPPSFGGKVGLAFRLCFGNVVPVSAIVLTVWLPANVAIAYALASSGSGDDFFASARLTNLVESVLGPPVAGAILWLLSERLEGRRSTYGAAMRVGLSHWGRLFGARFAAGLIIVVGLLALVVPGLVLAVRYSLIDPVVVLENSESPRSRSADLVRGRAWSIFLAWVLGLALMALVGVGAGVLPAFVPGLEGLGYQVVTDCLVDIVSVVVQALLLVYYWEARRQETGDLDAAVVSPGTRPPGAA